MVLISYDISNNKLRTSFNRFIRKYGGRLQFSVYEIDNSPTILNNIVTEITTNFEKKFSEEEEKTDNDFKAFNSNKEEVYYPDNEFVYNLCSGLINLSEINDLRDNK